MQKLYIKASDWAGSSLRYWVASVLIVVPLFPKFPLLSVSGVSVFIRLEDILIAVMLLVWLLAVSRDIRRVWSGGIERAIILFLFVGLASLISAIFLTRTVEAPVSFLHWARRVEYLSMFFVGLSAARNRGDIAFYIKILMLVAGFAFVFGVGQKYLNWPVITTQNSEYAKGIALRYREGSHLVSTFAGHYDLATYVILAVPLFWLLAFDKGKALGHLGIFKSIIISRIMVGLSAVSMLWLLVNAASRISIVSYLGSISLALLLARKYLYLFVVVVFSLAFIATSSNLIDRYMNIFDVALNRLVKVAHLEVNAQVQMPVAVPLLEDRSTSIRLNVEWPRALRAFYKNPLFGTGYSSISLATDNGYLRLLGEVGLLGFLAFFLVIGRLLVLLVPVVKVREGLGIEKVFVLGFLAAIPGVLLNTVFIDVFESSKFAIMFWLFAGMAVAVMRKNKYEKNS